MNTSEGFEKKKDFEEKEKLTHSPIHIFNQVLKVEQQALAECQRQFQSTPVQESLLKALSLFKKTLDAQGKIVLLGIGKSGKIAQKIAATFSSFGNPAIFLHPTEAMHGDLGLVFSKDIVFAISYSGNTEELIQLLPALKNRNVPIVGMGGNVHSRLANASHAWIDAKVQEEACTKTLAPTASTTVALALGDALAITLAKMRGLKERTFAFNHPGGALGRKFHLKLKDVMHQGSALASLPPQASVSEVITEATEKKLGAVLVLAEDQTLLGVITDGDLRRALRHKEKFFSLCAKNMMTTHPVTARKHQFAFEALELMEHRASQISILPIVDSQQKALGLVRLHDLAQLF